MQLTWELSEGTPSQRTHNTPHHYDILDALVLCVGHSGFWRQVLLQLWLPLQKFLALRIQTGQLTKRNACAVHARIAKDGTSSGSPHNALHSLVGMCATYSYDGMHDYNIICVFTCKTKHFQNSTRAVDPVVTRRSSGVTLTDGLTGGRGVVFCCPITL